MKSDEHKIIALIPCYREAGRIGDVVKGVLKTGVRAVVVDDGSLDDTAAEAEAAGALVIKHDVNKGKGAAIATGLSHAMSEGCDAVVMLDGDGQHAPDEITAFIEKFESDPSVFLIVGTRMSDTKDMPFVRRQTNRFMSWLLSRELGQRVHDTQCGFRLISGIAMPLAIGCSSGGFSAESEILLQTALSGGRIAEVAVSTIYGDEKSKIRPVRDTIRFFKMLARFRRERRAPANKTEGA